MLLGTHRPGAGPRRLVRAGWRAALVSACCGAMASGCASPGASVLSVMDARSTTVAFESIDGPPESVFRKLVQVLGEEATSRQVTVVSREAAAQYRIRGYVAAHVQSKRVAIAWG